MSRNSKPCPQCEGTIHRLKAGEPWPPLCFRCLSYIEQGKAAEAREARRKGFEDYNLPQKGEWPIHYITNDQGEHKVIIALRRALEDMLASACEPALSQDGYSGDTEHHLPSYGPSALHRVSISRRTAAKIRRFDEVLRTALQTEYATGVGDGKNLLKQLATGQISTHEFDSVERD